MAHKSNHDDAHSPSGYEHEVEGGGTWADGGQAQSPQSADVGGVDEGEAWVDQDGTQGGDREREYLAVDALAFEDATYRGIDFLSCSCPSTMPCCPNPDTPQKKKK